MSQKRFPFLEINMFTNGVQVILWLLGNNLQQKEEIETGMRNIELLVD